MIDNILTLLTQRCRQTLMLLTVISTALSLTATANDNATRRIIDKAGNTVIIPAHPQRIAIASDREFTEPFVAAGIIPVAVASQHEFAPFLTEALKKADNLIDLGHHREIDIEALAAAKPDLIIMRNINRYGSPSLYQAAVKIAPVVQLNSMSSLRDLINDIGNIMGDDVSARLNQRVDAAVAKMAHAVPDPSVIQVSHGTFYGGEFSIFKDNSNLASQLIKEAGYSRPPQQTTHSTVIDNTLPKLSLERLNALDGDILFLNLTDNQPDIDAILTSGLWQSLMVVQNKAVILSDWRYWNFGGPMAAEHIADDFIAGLKKAGLAQ